MPTKPRSPCSQPGCPKIAVQHGRCAEHARELRQRYEAGRPTSRERGYDGAWEAERKAYLAAHPYCVGVLVDGRRVHAAACDGQARHVDHVVPRRLGGTNNWANYQGLSHECHALKTAKCDGGYGNARR